jgi:hypothetical protein
VSHRHWALPKEQLFPIDTPDLVKTAASYFDAQVDEMTGSQRLVAARHICNRASELGVHVESSLAYKYASANLSPFFAQFLAMRKEASAHAADGDLDMLLAVGRRFGAMSDVTSRVTGLDKVAALLADFDARHGVSGVPDAEYSVYGQTADRDERLRLVVKVAGYEVTADDLAGADFDRLDGKVEVDIVAALRSNDGLAVFASLPEPHREIIYQNLFMD